MAPFPCSRLGGERGSDGNLSLQPTSKVSKPKHRLMRISKVHGGGSGTGESGGKNGGGGGSASASASDSSTSSGSSHSTISKSGSTNVASSTLDKDSYVDDETLRTGDSVEVWWARDEQWYCGVITQQKWSPLLHQLILHFHSSSKKV